MPGPQSTSGWQTFFNLGGMAGAFSLIWQIARQAREYHRRPRLGCRKFAPRDVFSFDCPEDEHRRVVTLVIQNIGRKSARGCIARATAQPLLGTGSLKSVALHWADIPIAYSSTGEAPVDIPAGGERRLDIAFCTSLREGCWLASLSAMNGNHLGDAELSEGDYRVDICVRFEDGDDCKYRLRIFAPRKWADLNADAM